jgi:hypothetical protein
MDGEVEIAKLHFLNHEEEPDYYYIGDDEVDRLYVKEGVYAAKRNPGGSEKRIPWHRVLWYTTQK